MILTIIVFLLILGVLVFVHELGHFVVAKWSGMRVDEFGLGFPPTLIKYKKGDTTYCLNSIPFGGYVKIHGETMDPEAPHDNDPRAFNAQSVGKRIAVIVAGVSMNLLFAILVLTIAFSVGFVAFSQDLSKVPGAKVISSQVVAVEVLKDGPAEKAGLLPGDYIISLSDPVTGKSANIKSVTELQQFSISERDAGVTQLILTYEREGVSKAQPIILNKEGYALGVASQSVDVVRLPIWQAPKAAIKEVGFIIRLTWDALAGFARKLFVHGQLDPTVSGPVGIYHATASAVKTGVVSTVFLLVALSINLALLNILPIPALDGGKLLFLLIEAVFGAKAINRKLESQVSLIGFLLVIGLIVILSVRDVIKLF